MSRKFLLLIITILAAMLFLASSAAKQKITLCVGKRDGRNYRQEACSTGCKGDLVPWKGRCQCGKYQKEDASDSTKCHCILPFEKDAQKKCVCPKGSSDKDGECVCNDQHAELIKGKCECKKDTFVSDGKCNKCTGGKLINKEKNGCECPKDMFDKVGQCTKCRSDKELTPEKDGCQCPKDTYDSGLQCKECTGGKLVNDAKDGCKCPNKDEYNKVGTCTKCINGQITNWKTCQCAGDEVEQGGTCKCPENQASNGQGGCIKNCQGDKKDPKCSNQDCKARADNGECYSNPTYMKKPNCEASCSNFYEQCSQCEIKVGGTCTKVWDLKNLLNDNDCNKYATNGSCVDGGNAWRKCLAACSSKTLLTNFPWAKGKCDP